MGRRAKILGNLNISNLTGIEIGALAFPLVTKKDGDIIYVDFTDTKSLREKYRDDKNVDVDNIVDIDAIWGENTLFEAIGKKHVDYVVASHVIEHVPDLLGWLGELRAVLKSSGEIRLAIPDKRYCFDFKRNETELADILSAHIVRARSPQPRQILDFVLNYVEVDRKKAWTRSEELNLLRNEISISSAMELVKSSLLGNYIDVHCWVFTPKSLARLFKRLAIEGLIDFECVDFYDTSPGEHEFFIGLRPCSDVQKIIQSYDSVIDSLQNFNSELNINLNTTSHIKYEGKIIKQPPSSRGKEDGWYLVKNGKKKWIVDESWLERNGYKASDVIQIESAEFNLIEEEPHPLQ